ncbi:MAG: hypothetical protein JKX95_05170, partial [Bacteroidia bacterium]|nr:hypothetical protein [Bacteroidia bacterium]
MKLPFIKLIYTSVCFSLLWNIVIAQIGSPFISNYHPKDYNSGSQNWCSAQDKRGIIYIGNSNYILEYDGVNFRKIPLPKGTVVRSIDINSEGVVFAGGQGDIGYLQSDSTGKNNFTSLLNEIPEENRSFDDVWNTICNNYGTYFLTDNFILRYHNGIINVIESESSFHLMFPIKDTLYIKERGNGLVKLIDNSLERIPYGNFFADIPIFSITTTDNGHLLIASMTDGLFIFKEGDEPKVFITEANEFLVKNLVYNGLKLNNDLTAFGTLKNGLLLINQDGIIQTNVTTSSNLLFDAINNVSLDHQNGLWATLDKGISRIEPASRFSFFNENDGINHLVYNLTKHKDILYLATSEGVYYFDDNAKNAYSEQGKVIKFNLIDN